MSWLPGMTRRGKGRLSRKPRALELRGPRVLGHVAGDHDQIGIEIVELRGEVEDHVLVLILEMQVGNVR